MGLVLVCFLFNQGDERLPAFIRARWRAAIILAVSHPAVPPPTMITD
jgi:hypothetical protein